MANATETTASAAVKQSAGSQTIRIWTQSITDLTKLPGCLVEAGVDVIIPAEGVINTVLVRNQVQQAAGVPVLDSYGALVAFAEMLVQLRRRSGLSIGRPGQYLRPAQELCSHLRSVTIDAPQQSKKATGGIGAASSH